MELTLTPVEYAKKYYTKFSGDFILLSTTATTSDDGELGTRTEVDGSVEDEMLPGFMAHMNMLCKVNDCKPELMVIINTANAVISSMKPVEDGIKASQIILDYFTHRIEAHDSEFDKDVLAVIGMIQYHGSRRMKTHACVHV